jgi:ATP-dependent protease HslVU (ClpYQ) peptidase subunit
MTTIITVQRNNSSFLASDTRVTINGGDGGSGFIAKVIAHRSGNAFIGIAGNANNMSIYSEIMDKIESNVDIIKQFAEQYSVECKERWLHGDNRILGIENGRSYTIHPDILIPYENNNQAYAIGSGGRDATIAFNVLVSESEKYSDIENLDDDAMKELLNKAIVIGAKDDPFTNEEVMVYKTTQTREVEKRGDEFMLSLGNTANKVELAMIIATNQVTAHNEPKQYTKDALLNLVERINSSSIPVMYEHGKDVALGRVSFGTWKQAKLVDNGNDYFEVSAVAEMVDNQTTRNFVANKISLGASMSCQNAEKTYMKDAFGKTVEVVSSLNDVNEISLTLNPSMSETRALQLALQNAKTRKDREHALKQRFQCSNHEATLIYASFKEGAKAEVEQELTMRQGNLDRVSLQGNLAQNSNWEMEKQNYESKIVELKSQLANKDILNQKLELLCDSRRLLMEKKTKNNN